MSGVVPELPKFQFKSALGVPLINGTITAYLAGTTTLTNTWQDLALSSLNTNPIVLDSRGEALIYLDPTLTYKFVLKNSVGATQWTLDDISGLTLLSLPFIQPATGAVSRSAQDRMRDVVCVFDFMTPAQVAGIRAHTLLTSVSNEINAAALYCSQNNKSLYFPSGRYGCTNLVPYSNVDYFGDGDASQLFLVENGGNTAHIFYGVGLARDTYYLRNWRALNNVSAGNAVTLTTAAQAANYAIGDLVVVASTGYLSAGGNDRQPYYALLNKVVSSDAATGIVTLESPIFDAIVGAQIAKQNDFTSAPPSGADQFCANSTWHDLLFDCSTRPAGVQAQSLAVAALYRCHVYDITIKGASSAISQNGNCYTSYERIKCVDMLPGTGSMRVLELKTGSYSSTYRDIDCDSYATATISFALIEFGEYAHRITAENITLIAPGITCTATYVVGPSASIGNHYKFRDIHFELAACDNFVSNNAQTSAGFSDYSGLEIKGCTINSPSAATVVRCVANTLGTAQFVFDGIEAVQAPTTQAIVVENLDGATRSVIQNVKADGQLSLSWSKALSAMSGADLTIQDCTVSKVVNVSGITDPASRAQPWQIGVRNISRFREKLVRGVGNVEQARSTSVTATGSTTVFSGAFPAWASFGWSYGDQIRFEIEGEFIGAVGAKTLTLTETVSGDVLAAPTSGVAGKFRISGQIAYYGSSNCSGFIESQSAGVIASFAYLRAPANLAFSLVANIASAGDQLRLYKARIYPELAHSGAVMP